jgi:hypothetical protein
MNLYYTYGIKNNFGIDFDPNTGNLWDAENGPEYGDGLNLVKPGFNSGWITVQGIWKPIKAKIRIWTLLQLISSNSQKIWQILQARENIVP